MKIKIIIIICAISLLLFAGCDPIRKNDFDATFLSGYWQMGSVHEYYNENGTGYTWDTADDVTEEEAQPFTWTLSGTTLTHIHKMEMGGVVPKTYTVKILNATTLSYRDDYGKTYLFTRQQ